MIPTHFVLGLSALLFVIGIAGVVIRRNLIGILVSVEVMLLGVNVAFIGFDRIRAEELVAAGASAASAGAAPGQTFALMILVLAVSQVVIGLALGVGLVRGRDTIDVADAGLLRW